MSALRPWPWLLGLALESISFLALIPSFSPARWTWIPNGIATLLLLACAFWLIQRAHRDLGRQMRFQASANPDAVLVSAGIYGILRHPFYTSLCLVYLAGASALMPPWPLFLGSAAVFAFGTALRIRSEEALLAKRFGAEWIAYTDRVPAVLPRLRSLVRNLLSTRP